MPVKRFNVIDREICIALDCEIGDIMEVNAGEGEKK